MRLRLPRPTYANVASTLALVIAMSGTAYAVNTVGTSDIQDLAVTTPKLADEAASSAKIAPSAVNGSKVSDNSLTLSDIKGINQTGAINFSVPAHSCSPLTFSVSGAVAGQAALITWTSGLPSSIVLSPLRVASSTQITGRACNFGSTNATVSNLSVRIVTFG